VEDRIIAIGKTIRIKSIRMRFELTVPAVEPPAEQSTPWVSLGGIEDRRQVRGAGPAGGRLRDRDYRDFTRK
jgi:hypothetical protein